MNIASPILMLTALVFFSVACKKGENDPWSLRSRKSRLEGIWILSEAHSLDQYQSSSSYTTDIVSSVKDGEKTTYVVSHGSAGIDTLAPELTYWYQHEIGFDKNGNFTWDEYSAYDTLRMKGYWYFLGRNKQLDLKNKEAIEIVISESNEGMPDSESYAGFAPYPDYTWYIDRLSENELVLLSDKEIEVFIDGSHWHISKSWSFVKME